MHWTLFIMIINIILLAVFVGIIILVICALLKYLKSKEVRKEKSVVRKSLGEALKEHRTLCKMTQEFVAETIGVSRQAVSKWENGISDPSTSNLIALAKLYNVPVEDLIKEVI
ncbi:helix-turn-helix transcriptional regulator [Sedimentibacter sp. zth1]|uniref:helix-turn-helix domain-containing protein n=1 Tax=Sedimentibacter sp. zth1 TaxID=2816908 RepID=UPI001A92D056|nr:helix-turn-helix transcriptional regulator [Sedimentibacter sp. zth1]QSX05913.1 helix-turn-helix transcriptional regulator [Sedimentibacter sp. zth1]